MREPPPPTHSGLPRAHANCTVWNRLSINGHTTALGDAPTTTYYTQANTRTRSSAHAAVGPSRPKRALTRAAHSPTNAPW